MAAPSSPPPPDIFRLLLALAVGVGDAAGFGEARTGVPGEPGGGNEPSGRLADPAPCPVPVSDGGLAGSADEGRFGRFTVGGVGGVTVILGGLGGRCALAGLPIAMSSRHSKPTLPQLGMCPTANPTCIQAVAAKDVLSSRSLVSAKCREDSPRHSGRSLLEITGKARRLATCNRVARLTRDFQPATWPPASDKITTCSEAQPCPPRRPPRRHDSNRRVEPHLLSMMRGHYQSRNSASKTPVRTASPHLWETVGRQRC
jgi:hypothetical protein